MALSVETLPGERAAGWVGSPAIEARGVGMSFPGGGAALRDVTFQAAAGELLAILGPSGCGKSTLLRLIAGLLSRTMGTLTVSLKEPREARTVGVRPAFVFQDPTLLPWRTVVENIRLPLELDHQPRADHASRIQSALQLVGLREEDLKKRPRMLSGGMRMRVSLARALVTQPNLLLLDEPFAALDEVLRQQLNEDLVRLWQAGGWTTLFVTHNVSEAVFLSQRVLVMSARPGTVLADVLVPFEYPRTPELRGSAEFARFTNDLSRRLREAAR